MPAKKRTWTGTKPKPKSKTAGFSDQEILDIIVAGDKPDADKNALASALLKKHGFAKAEYANPAQIFGGLRRQLTLRMDNDPALEQRAVELGIITIEEAPPEESESEIIEQPLDPEEI